MHKYKLWRLAIIAFVWLAVVHPLQAANWLMLQGTEPPAAAGRAKLWGFIQPQYQKDFSDAHANGTYIPPKLIGPNLSSQDQFNVLRARIGVRGQGFPLDSKTNYFILGELGNNAITAANKGSTFITDASITLNHIKPVRVRAGLFKYPGAEEGLQAIHVFDYINFTTVSNQLLLERFANDDNYIKNAANSGNIEAQNIDTGTVVPNGFDKPVGAFRDVGIQLFSNFKSNKWEHSYAIMMGNGNGLNFGDNDDNKDLYVYWSSELIYGGKGPRREGLKLFAWHQTGKRSYDTNYGAANAVGEGLGAVTLTEYDRDRTGFGVKFLRNGIRVTAEYMTGKGMIFLGPHKESFDMNAPGGPGDGLEGEAMGYYLEGGYRFPKTPWEVDLRYDFFDRLQDDPLEVEFTNITLGVQYFFNKKTRVALNYEIHDAESVNGLAPLEAHFDGLDNRLAVQLTAIF